jgi:hypothetical protein
VAARSKARLNAGIIGSNLVQCMDVCVGLFCVCVALCVSSGFAKGWSPIQGVLPTVCRIKKLKLKTLSDWRLCFNLSIFAPHFLTRTKFCMSNHKRQSGGINTTSQSSGDAYFQLTCYVNILFPYFTKSVELI